MHATVARLVGIILVMGLYMNNGFSQDNNKISANASYIKLSSGNVYEGSIKINAEMLKNYNESSEESINWKELLTSYDTQSLGYFYALYSKSDLDLFTMEALKEKMLAMQNNAANKEIIKETYTSTYEIGTY